MKQDLRRQIGCENIANHCTHFVVFLCGIVDLDQLKGFADIDCLSRIRFQKRFQLNAAVVHFFHSVDLLKSRLHPLIINILFPKGFNHRTGIIEPQLTQIHIR